MKSSNSPKELVGMNKTFERRPLNPATASRSNRYWMTQTATLDKLYWIRFSRSDFKRFYSLNNPRIKEIVRTYL